MFVFLFALLCGLAANLYTGYALRKYPRLRTIPHLKLWIGFSASLTAGWALSTVPQVVLAVCGACLAIFFLRVAFNAGLLFWQLLRRR